MSNIIYAPKSWNPMEGCSKVSEGCRFCWALAIRRRFGGGKVLGQPPVTEPVLRPDRLDAPLHWRKPQTVAMGFMGDWCHPGVPDEFIDKVFAVMALTPQHTYLLLTKRPERMREYLREAAPRIDQQVLNDCEDRCTGTDAYVLSYRWPLPNVWLGVSCENQARADERIPLLLDTPAAHRWVSLEPLLGKIDLRPWLGAEHLRKHMIDGEWYDGCSYCLERRRHGGTGITRLDWIVIGGESGPHARPCDLGWIRDINGQCEAAGVKRYIKQVGAKPVIDYYDEDMRNLYDERGLLWPDPVGWNSYRDGQPRIGSLVNPCGVVRDRKGENPDEWPPDLRVRETPEGEGE